MPRSRKGAKMKTLPELVQSLPPELYAEIYKHTFTATPGEEYRIDRSYKPPLLLQVDRKSRELFAKSYYANSIFTIRVDLFCLYKNWIAVIPKDHKALLQEVRSESLLRQEEDSDKVWSRMFHNFLLNYGPWGHVGSWKEIPLRVFRFEKASYEHPVSTWLCYWCMTRSVREEGDTEILDEIEEMGFDIWSDSEQ